MQGGGGERGLWAILKGECKGRCKRDLSPSVSTLCLCLSFCFIAFRVSAKCRISGRVMVDSCGEVVAKDDYVQSQCAGFLAFCLG